MTFGGVETRYARVVRLMLLFGGIAVAGVGQIVADAPNAAAACLTEDTPLATITGRVVDASMQDWDYTLAVLDDDGTKYTVKMFGRRPPGDGTTVENTVEDSYVGIRPEVGGRYSTTGSLDNGGVLRVDACVVGAKVDLLDEDPASTTATATATPLESTAAKSKPDDDEHRGMMLLVVIVALAVGAITVRGTMVGIRRRSSRADPPTSSP